MPAPIVHLMAVLLPLAATSAFASDAPAPAAAIDPQRAAQIDTLLGALANDDSFKVRLQAAVLLGRVGDGRAVEPLINALNNDPHYTVRAAAATALANLNELRAVTQIIRRMALDTESFVREEARRALAKYERQSALPYAVSAFGAPEPQVRREALAYIAAEPNPMTEPVLAKGLGDSPEVFAVAKEAVGRLSPDERLRFLDSALDHREPAVRRGAIEALDGTPSVESTKLVLKVYERDVEEDEVKRVVRQSLRDLRQYLPLDEIQKEAATSPDKHLRSRSLRLLGVVGGGDAEKVLVLALADGDPYIRGNAVMALGELGDPAVAPALQKLADDPANQRIVHLIRHTLKQLQTRRERAR
jgi:HEAT repeat protein